MSRWYLSSSPTQAQAPSPVEITLPRSAVFWSALSVSLAQLPQLLLFTCPLAAALERPIPPMEGLGPSWQIWRMYCWVYYCNKCCEVLFSQSIESNLLIWTRAINRIKSVYLTCLQWDWEDHPLLHYGIPGGWPFPLPACQIWQHGQWLYTSYPSSAISGGVRLVLEYKEREMLGWLMGHTLDIPAGNCSSNPVCDQILKLISFRVMLRNLFYLF